MSSRIIYDGESSLVFSSDSEEDGSECLDLFFSSSSVDRSSVNSIPWAEDAIKQNQIDWELLERQIHGEVDLLQEESDLKNEILDWQRKFPQFRTHSTLLAPPEKLLHPLKRKSDAELVTMLKNDLRISSVPMTLRKKNQKTDTHFIVLPTKKPPPLLLQRSKPYHPKQSESMLFSGSTKLSNSASFIRMPPINGKTGSFDHARKQSPSASLRKSFWNHSISHPKSQIVRANRNSIILPSLNIEKLRNPAFSSVGGKSTNRRSISAAFHHPHNNRELSASSSFITLPLRNVEFKVPH